MKPLLRRTLVHLGSNSALLKRELKQKEIKTIKILYYQEIFHLFDS